MVRRDAAPLASALAAGGRMMVGACAAREFAYFYLSAASAWSMPRHGRIIYTVLYVSVQAATVSLDSGSSAKYLK